MREAHRLPPETDVWVWMHGSEAAEEFAGRSNRFLLAHPEVVRVGQ
jgi:hypothetical protein